MKVHFEADCAGHVAPMLGGVLLLACLRETRERPSKPYRMNVAHTHATQRRAENLAGTKVTYDTTSPVAHVYDTTSLLPDVAHFSTRSATPLGAAFCSSFTSAWPPTRYVHVCGVRQVPASRSSIFTWWGRSGGES